MGSTLRAGLVLVGALALSDPAGSGLSPEVKGCRARCQRDFGNQRTDICDQIPCMMTQHQCVEGAKGDDKVVSCKNGCFDGRQPGRCTNLLHCLNTCRRMQARLVAGCRTGCPDGRECRADLTGLRAACRRGCGTTAAVTSPRAESAPAAGRSCQGRCVGEVASGCFGDCRDKCEGDTEAEGMCFRACRDKLCVLLEVRCTNDWTDADGKKILSNPLTCCAQLGSSCPIASFQSDGPFVCNQITTTTSTSSTTIMMATSSTTTASTTTTTLR